MKSILQHQLRLSPLFIIDHNLSYALADALFACGYDVTSIKAVFPNKAKVEDEEIIDWLEKQGRERSVWITADEKAQKVHAKYILAKEISVLWVIRPKNGLSTLKALQLLSLIIEPLAQLISSTKQPLYLRTSLVVSELNWKDLSPRYLIKGLSLRKSLCDRTISPNTNRT